MVELKEKERLEETLEPKGYLQYTPYKDVLARKRLAAGYVGAAALEDPVPLTPVHEVLDREGDLESPGADDVRHDQLVRPLERQRLQKHAVDYAEDGSSRADPQRYGQCRDGREARSLAQRPCAVTHVLPEGAHRYSPVQVGSRIGSFEIRIVGVAGRLGS